MTRFVVCGILMLDGAPQLAGDTVVIEAASETDAIQAFRDAKEAHEAEWGKPQEPYFWEVTAQVDEDS